MEKMNNQSKTVITVNITLAQPQHVSIVSVSLLACRHYHLAIIY